MKQLKIKVALAAPLLALTVAISSGSSLAAAPDAAGPAPSAQRERTETLPGVRSPDTVQGARERGAEAQGRVESQLPRDDDRTETPGQQACENSHAPTGSPSVAENDNAQGGNPQANENAQGSRADEYKDVLGRAKQDARAEQNQSEQGAANSRADLAQAGDDCLDANETIREQNEDARGQGTGNNPTDRDAGNQSRNPQR